MGEDPREEPVQTTAAVAEELSSDSDEASSDAEQLPSVSDSLASLKAMQRDFEMSKKQKRMSVWEQNKREEFASLLAKKDAVLSPRGAGQPTGADVNERFMDEEEIEAQRQWEEMREKEKKEKAAKMQELRAKREAEEQRRKTRELTAIRDRLAMLDEMDDEELQDVLAPKEEEIIDDEVEVEEVEDVVTFNFEDVIPGSIEGYLLKANASTKLLQPNWRTRWFRLQEDTLVYYRERQVNVLAKDNPPDGVVSLGSVKSIEACAPLRDSHRNCTFKIVAPERTYFLAAETKEDMETWLQVLNRAKKFYCKEQLLASAPIGAKSDSEMAGCLEKLGTFNKWHRRYFILKDGILFRYKTLGGDREQLGKLPLYGTELNEYKPDKFERCFALKDAKGNELILRASTEEDMHAWLNAIVKQKVMIEETVNSIVIM